MTSSPGQEDPSGRSALSVIADLALPAVPVTRPHLPNAAGFVAARIRLINLISEGSLVAASIAAYSDALPKLRAPDTGRCAVRAAAHRRPHYQACLCDGHGRAAIAMARNRNGRPAGPRCRTLTSC